MTVIDVSVEDGFAMLRDLDDAVLIDVRTPQEWTLVGVPDLESIGKSVRFVAWSEFGTGLPNPNFADEALDGLDAQTPLLFLCRSGVRSKAAGALAAQAGFAKTYNLQEGFEGDVNADGHRDGGWKHVGLPWGQR